MGFECRLIAIALAGGMLLSAGCSKDEDALRRQQLLAADEARKARKKRVDDKRTLSPEGELLPSQTKAFGIVVPRGFESKYTEEHVSTYDGNLPREKVLAYFERRLQARAVEPRDGDMTVFLDAREKSDPNMKPIVVRVSPTPSKPRWTRIEIGERPPAPPMPVETDIAAIRARFAEDRKNAR